eukprot:9033963-Alexandrium_andersonii.AAC.1
MTGKRVALDRVPLRTRGARSARGPGPSRGTVTARQRGGSPAPPLRTAPAGGTRRTAPRARRSS